jgi:mRNA interferase YafQ
VTTGEKNPVGTAKSLTLSMMEVVSLLAADKPLPRGNFDHPLSCEWSDHRDCHLKPDLILLYRKPDDDSLELVAPRLA